MSSFTENLYLKKAIQQLQEENTHLKQMLREYDFDAEMAGVTLTPFDPNRPNDRPQSTGERAAKILHDYALQAHASGLLKGPPPKHPDEMDEGELMRHTGNLLAAVPTEHHQPILGVVGHIIAHHPQWNLDLHNMGGANNTRGAADLTLSPIENLARLRISQLGRRPPVV